MAIRATELVKLSDDNSKVIITTTNETVEIIKKSSLEARRITLIEEHEKALALIDEKLAYFSAVK